MSRGRGDRWGGRSTQEHGAWGRKTCDKSQVKCFECNQLGHYASECKQKKTQDPEINLTQQQEDEHSTWETSNRDIWYLDNGASNHMTGCKDLFAELEEKVTGQVRFGNGSKVQIRGKGTLLFDSKNGDQFVLPNVYYIPALHNNIMSLGQMTEDGYDVRMTKDYLKVHDVKGRLIMKVYRSPNRLYKQLLIPGKPACLTMKLEEESWLWHARMGHANFIVLENMARKGYVTGMPCPKQTCEDCLVAKQTRRSFPKESEWRANEPLKLIHANLCGPITPQTKGGNRYFLLLVDDYSRYMWVYLLKSKDEAFTKFKQFKIQVEKETSYAINMLRTDRGGEFNSQKFNEFCQEEGIRRQFSAPHTPQQNGVVERRNRTILRMTRSLLKTMKVPDSFWGEVVRHSVYLLNRVGTKALKNSTPFEAWRGHKPTLHHLKVFGCTTFVKVMTHQTKLGNQCEAMVYLGMEEGSKAYRLFSPNQKRIVISRDVEFDERKPWAWKEFNTDEVSTPPMWVFNEDGSPSVEVPAHEEEEVSLVTPLTLTPNSVNFDSTGTPFQVSSSQSNSNHASRDHSPIRGFRKIEDIYQGTNSLTKGEVRNLYDRNQELLLIGDEPVSFEEA
ncbi:hypothetical protein E3N88_42252 [Mikania micrantha]|uniref:Integrase catalytic domain-containing protein n=1 Tax=Mikania micrantha TaxID=192012 RepID=A0A5N6LID1_9ASTR|nr:hypothetical protein E3N88_42252 [Mikania micrantha]